MRFRGMSRLMLLLCVVSLFFHAKKFTSVLFQMPEPTDEATPKEARSHTGFDGNKYELVFSDKFEVSYCLIFFVLLHPFFIFVLVSYYSPRPQPPYSPTTTSVVFSRSHPHVSIASSWVEPCTPFFRV